MNKLLNSMGDLLSTVILSPLTWIDTKWKDDEIPKAHKHSVVLLSLIYFCQLFAFRYINTKEFKIVDPSIYYEVKVAQFCATILGGLLTAALVIYLRKNKVTNSIKRTIILSYTLLIICIFMYIFFFDYIREHQLFTITRFITGFLNAAFIGLSITWLVESIFKYLRTTAALYLVFWGYLGGIMAVSVDVINSNYIQLIVASCLCLLSLILLFFNKSLINDARIVRSFYSKEKKEKHYKGLHKFWVWRERKAVLASVTLGMIIQYFDYLASNAVKFGWTEHAPFIRYTFCAFATFAFIFYFKRKDIYKKDGVIFSMILISFLLNIFLINFHTSFNSEVSSTILFIIIGILSSLWTLSILHVAEQFDLEKRLWMILLAPNFYRGAELILHWRMHNLPVLTPDDKGLLLEVLKNDNLNKGIHNFIDALLKNVYPPDAITAILTWGAIISFIGIFGILYLKSRNHEKNPLGSEVEEEGLINSKEVLENINKIEANSENNFFEQANKIISTHLKDIFNHKLYISSIYYKSSAEIKHAPYLEAFETFDCYTQFNEQDVKNGKAFKAHSISTQMVKNNRHDSFIEQLFNDNRYNAGLMFNPGRENCHIDDFENKLKIVDLTNYQVQNYPEIHSAIERFEDDNEVHIREFPDMIFKNKELNNDKDYRLNSTYALFNVDAQAYNKGEYYLYLIKPIRKGTPSSMLMLKTNEELSEGNLKRLESLISTVQAKRDEVRSAEKQKIKNALNSSALSSHFIKNMIDNLRDFYKEEKDDKLKDILTDKVKNVFTKNLGLDEENTTVEKEIELIKDYIYVYFITKLHTIDDKKAFLGNVKQGDMPFGWEKISCPDRLFKLKIPKGILQPLIENALEKSGFNGEEKSKIDLKIDITLPKDSSTVNYIEIRMCNNYRQNFIDTDKITRRIAGIERKIGGVPSSLYFINQCLLDRNIKIAKKSIEFSDDTTKKRFTMVLRIAIKESEKRAKYLEGIPERDPDISHKLKTVIVDDNNNQLEKIMGYIKENTAVRSILNITKQANDINQVQLNDFDLLISDLMLSEDNSGEENWSITHLIQQKDNILKSNLGIILISRANDKKQHIEKIMQEHFPLHFLGFTEKRKGKATEDIDCFLNIYYSRFKSVTNDKHT